MNKWGLNPINLATFAGTQIGEQWTGLGPIVLDLPYLSEELTDKSNSG
jgi:hypothetical protein